MNPVLRGNFKMALASVRASKWRSFLTMLGIIIGVVSVVTVVSIGQGVKNEVNGQINQLGKDLITVRPGQLVDRSKAGTVNGVNLFGSAGMTGVGSLSEDDLNQVQRSRGVRTAVPLSLVNGEVKVNDTSFTPTVLGTTSQLPDIVGQKVAYGEFFDADTSETPNVAIVGSGIANHLFKRRIPLGQTFEFLGQTFYIRGVFSQFDVPPLSMSTDFNNAIFIPESTAQSLTNNNAQIYEILAKPNDPKQAPATVDAITASLQRSHQNQQRFTVLQQTDTLAVTNQILDVLTRMIAGVAAISLLVGGIGIMNVMLVSVAERMHEIGIRKALGATNRQVLAQFMAESIVLSSIGGILGIVCSFIVTFLLSSFTNLTPAINWPVTGVAFVISVLVGIIFGTTPALKAARKDPIEALRNE